MPEFPSFLRWNNIAFMYKPHSVYPFSCWWILGCFHILVIANNASMKMGVQISLKDSAFNLGGIYPEVELLKCLLFFKDYCFYSHSNHVVLVEAANQSQHYAFSCLRWLTDTWTPDPREANKSSSLGVFRVELEEIIQSFLLRKLWTLDAISGQVFFHVEKTLLWQGAVKPPGRKK